MKDLIRHIEYLLLDNDCVVISGFGGFVTCNETARYIDEENLFLPPIRTVGFNKDLTVDDGLLIKSIMETRHITEEEANIFLSEQLADFNQELQESGTYDMGSIGTFYTDEEKNMRFSPCMAGTVCPGYYGLDSLTFPKLADKGESKESAPAASKNMSLEKNKGEIVLRIKKSWLNNIAAVAAVVIAFFLVSQPVMNTGKYDRQEAGFPNIIWNNRYTEQTVTVPQKAAKTAETAETVQSAKTAETGTAAVQVQAAETPAEVKKAAESFCIVIASAITEENANNYVKQLKKEGYNNAAVYNNGKIVRVILQGYSSKEEAAGNLESLRKGSEEFSSAWILSI